MAFARNSGGTSIADVEQAEAKIKDKAKGDISVSPLATPLLADPGAIG